MNSSKLFNNDQTQLKNFLPISKLGEGAFSTVYKVKRITDGQIYALKKIKLKQLKEKEKQNSLNQIRILASIKSKFIISYKEAFYDNSLNLLCIVMEHANGGDLQKKITSNQSVKKNFDEQQIWKGASQILIGLYVLHEKGILHRDLKSANVFISNDIYKLGDLNVSKVNYQKNQMARTQTGTPYYASPEVWRDQAYDSKCDIWSFGCLIYEMCCFEPPFRGSDLDQLYKSVQKGKYSQIPSFYSNELKSLIKSCLKVCPKQRSTSKQLIQRFGIIKSFFIQSYKNNQIQTENSLLNTIRLPFDLTELSKNLPLPEYEMLAKQQPQTMYKQNQSKKQTVMLKNKQNNYKKQTNQARPLPQRIKSYFNQSQKASIKKRPQRPLTSVKNNEKKQFSNQKRPPSAAQYRKKPIVPDQNKVKIDQKSEIMKQQIISQSNLNTSQSKNKVARQIKLSRPISSQKPKIVERSYENRHQIIQQRCKSSSSNNENLSKKIQLINNHRQNNCRIPSAPSQYLGKNSNKIERNQKTRQKQNLNILPVKENVRLPEQIYYQICKQNGLKKVLSLQKKVKCIKQQRKQNRLNYQKNKQNICSLKKQNLHSQEKKFDLKQQLKTKIKQNSQIFRNRNYERAALNTPLIQQRDLNIGVLQKIVKQKNLYKADCLQSIKQRLQIRKNNISTRRCVVSAQSKRVRSFANQNSITDQIIAAQKVRSRKFGMVKNISQNFHLPSILCSRRMNENLKNNRKNISDIINRDLRSVCNLNVTNEDCNISIGKNLIDDSDTIVRLKRQIKNRMVANKSKLQDKYRVLGNNLNNISQNQKHYIYQQSNYGHR